MNNKFLSSVTKVVVGINFDEFTDEFVESVEGFARATKSKLTLVHVWEPHNYYTPLSTAPYTNLGSVMFESEKEDLEKRMERLVPRFKDLLVTTKVMSGYPPQILEAEAVSSDADLVVIGANKGRYSMFPNMLSTALELSSSSPKSTMIIPPGTKSHWNEGPWRVLVADDLEEHSQPAIHMGNALCGKTDSFEFHHFHAHRVGKKMLRETADRILSFMSQKRIPFDEQFSQDNYLNQIQTEIENKMSERMGDGEIELTNLGGRYHSHIRYGKVKDSMEEVINEVFPHMIILGRHEAFHRKPFGIGKLPFHALAHSEIPIIIAV
jgi:nucleotide-binding universal stress UspA family protein